MFREPLLELRLDTLASLKPPFVIERELHVAVLRRGRQARHDIVVEHVERPGIDRAERDQR